MCKVDKGVYKAAGIGTAIAVPVLAGVGVLFFGPIGLLLGLAGLAVGPTVVGVDCYIRSTKNPGEEETPKRPTQTATTSPSTISDLSREARENVRRNHDKVVATRKLAEKKEGLEQLTEKQKRERIQPTETKSKQPAVRVERSDVPPSHIQESHNKDESQAPSRTSPNVERPRESSESFNWP